MPWKINRDGELRCTVCKGREYIKCKAKHKKQPPNEIDNQTGEPFYRCPECDWAEGGDDSGTTLCPECEAGERKDTFEGDDSEKYRECEGCEKDDVGAVIQRLPDEIIHNGVIPFPYPEWVACDPCHQQWIAEIRQDIVRAQQAQQGLAAAGGPVGVGTCDRCRTITDLAIVGDMYYCGACLVQICAV